MKYLTTILISIIIIFGTAYVVCEKQKQKIYNEFTEYKIAENFSYSFDTIQHIAERIQTKNHTQHNKDLHKIDSLRSKIENISTLNQKKKSNVGNVTHKDTIIYRVYYKDTNIINYDTTFKDTIILIELINIEYTTKKEIRKEKRKK